MDIQRKDIETHYGESRSYQEKEFDKIAEAIRYVDGTTKEKDPIVALDFWKRIRALKGSGGGGEWTGSCCFGDNIPTGCGEIHGVQELDYKIVNCVTARMKDPSDALGDGCLCEDNFAYGPPTCEGLYGVLELDYTLVGDDFPYNILWGYYIDAGD